MIAASEVITETEDSGIPQMLQDARDLARSYFALAMSAGYEAHQAAQLSAELYQNMAISLLSVGRDT